ncbi:MAG: hypothetical protein HGA36_00005, partial [Candidatus Moranbacteria bacterium]|nr:hypothetical protein [Candidatus Moranbacteria bacterium]
AIAKDGGMLEIPTFNRSSQELCSDEQGKIACYVTKNQILGLEVPSGANGITNVSWKVNGIEMACNTSISSQCSDGGRILFFPIIGNVGEAVDVVATALNDKKESVEVSRHFVIGSAQLQIVSADNPSSYCSIDCINALNACPKYLGHYNSLDGSKSPDCSLKVWQTTEGKTVTLSAPGQSGFDWSIDGQIIAEYQNQNQIQILIDKTAGESYNIGLTTHLLPGGRSQLNNTRLALYKNWKVAPEEATEENQATDIQLDVVASSGQAIAKAKTGIFGASLITHLPEQLMFLLKISLTSVLMFLVTGLIFAIIPETLFKKEELN